MILNCYKDYDNHIKTYPEDDYEGMMVFNPENYEDISEMWSDISQFMNILAKNNRAAIMYPEERLIIIQFGYNERTNPMGGSRPVWISEDEYEELMQKRYDFEAKVREEKE